MGGVFFRRRRRAQSEALNDRSGDVVNLFRVVKNHPAAFVEEYRLQLYARAEFDRHRAADIGSLTDVQRAARFYFLQRARFSGLPVNWSFPATPLKNKSIDPDTLLRHIDRAYRRLSTVTIENLDFGEFIRLYDRPTTVFYVDPPYWGKEGYYGKGLFDRDDFERLAAVLRRLRGRFILSLNDVPEVRRLFAWAVIEEEPVTYKFKGTKRVTELVITGPLKRLDGTKNPNFCD